MAQGPGDLVLQLLFVGPATAATTFFKTFDKNGKLLTG